MPVWLVAAVIARDIIIVCGAGAYRLLLGRLDVAPTMASKANTILQVVLAVVALLARGLGVLPAWIMDILVYAVFASTAYSGLQYVTLWSRRAWMERSSNKP